MNNFFWLTDIKGKQVMSGTQKGDIDPARSNPRTQGGGWSRSSSPLPPGPTGAEAASALINQCMHSAAPVPPGHKALLQNQAALVLPQNLRQNLEMAPGGQRRMSTSESLLGVYTASCSPGRARPWSRVPGWLGPGFLAFSARVVFTLKEQNVPP